MAICPDDLERALVMALPRMAEHSAAPFKAHRWPTLLNYRIAFGLATGSRGGMSLQTMAAWALGVGDRATCPEEMFDDYVPPAELKIESRPRVPVDMHKWAKQARNGIRVHCLVRGGQHWDERSSALYELLRMSEEVPRKCTDEFVKDAWEKLNSRWWEELKWKVKEVLRACNKGQPRKEDFISRP